MLHPDGATLLIKTILQLIFFWSMLAPQFLSELSSSPDCHIISSPSLIHLRVAGSNLIKIANLMFIHTDLDSFLMLPIRCTCGHFP